MAQLQIAYLNHSGFSVAYGKTCLVFDYYPAAERKPGTPGVITSEELAPFERVLVFVSHSHEDHFDLAIYEWQDEARVHYILGDDVPARWPGERMKPGEEKDFGDIRVRAFDSTDLGVSFLVKLPEYTLFHAGDLNLWHWRQESSLREIEAAERAFYDAIEPIKQETIDVAMFPVDPRQGLMYDAGANHFILTLKPRVFIPMHWQDRPEVAIDFARRARNQNTEVLALTRPGVVANITFEDTLLDIHIIEPPKDLDELPLAPRRRPEPAGPLADGEDPFADSDLPVQIDP